VTERAKNAAAGREDILRAATDLFGEAGFDAVSINAIARSAATSKANVFHHFGSKEQLYLAVMREACGQFAGVIDTLGEGGGGFGERVAAFVREDLATMRSQPDQSHLILREILESGPCRGRALAGEVFDEQFGRIVELFRDGQAAGEVAVDVPPALVASMLIACNVFLFQSQHVLRHLPGVDFVDDPDRYAALVSRVLFDGLRVREDGHGGRGSDA
jgi:TetR/AcrR family transcriptional regulator